MIHPPAQAAPSLGNTPRTRKLHCGQRDIAAVGGSPRQQQQQQHYT